MKKAVLLILSFGLFFLGSTQGQSLYFPNGNTLNLTTNTSYLYLETKIPFYTVNSKITDWRFKKTVDSIDTRWEYSGCFNGDCTINLTDSGNFIADFGDSDTSGFIAFHVNTNELNGSTRIEYLVLNKENPNIFSTLIFNIIYYKPGTGFGDLGKSSFLVNYLGNNIWRFEPTLNLLVNIYQLNGNKVKSENFSTTKNIDLNELANGIYLLECVDANDKKYFQKLLVQH